MRGFKEEGTTTPFDMVVRNDMDRYHLAIDVIERVPKLGYVAAYAKQELRNKLIDHQAHNREWGDDPPEIQDWRWASHGSIAAPTDERGRVGGQPAGMPD